GPRAAGRGLGVGSWHDNASCGPGTEASGREKPLAVLPLIENSQLRHGGSCRCHHVKRIASSAVGACTIGEMSWEGKSGIRSPRKCRCQQQRNGPTIHAQETVPHFCEPPKKDVPVEPELLSTRDLQRRRGRPRWRPAPWQAMGMLPNSNRRKPLLF